MSMLGKTPKAGTCAVHKYHWPVPLRTVNHHIQPQEMGGMTTTLNLVPVCDTGHYNIHTLLTALVKTNTLPLKGGTRRERALALQGYAAWVTAGKPNEEHVKTMRLAGM
jgi:hypothetical protein